MLEVAPIMLALFLKQYKIGILLIGMVRIEEADSISVLWDESAGENVAGCL